MLRKKAFTKSTNSFNHKKICPNTRKFVMKPLAIIFILTIVIAPIGPFVESTAIPTIEPAPAVALEPKPEPVGQVPGPSQDNGDLKDLLKELVSSQTNADARFSKFLDAQTQFMKEQAESSKRLESKLDEMFAFVKDNMGVKPNVPQISASTAPAPAAAPVVYPTVQYVEVPTANGGGGSVDPCASMVLASSGCDGISRTVARNTGCGASNVVAAMGNGCGSSVMNVDAPGAGGGGSSGGGTGCSTAGQARMARMRFRQTQPILPRVFPRLRGLY